MAKIINILCAMSLLLNTAICMAGEGRTNQKTDQVLVQTLMQKSGLNKQLEQIPRMMYAGIVEAGRQSQQQMTPQQFSDLNGMIAAAFNAQALNDAVQKHIQSNLSEGDVKSVLTWLSSSLGEKITKLEEDASTPEAYAEMQKMAGDLLKNSARVALIKRLDRAVKASETGVSTALDTQIAMVTAMAAGIPQDKRPSFNEIVSQINKSSAQVKTMVERQTLVSLVYAYRTLTDAEIGEYITFAESESGKKYHAVTSAGLHGAMVEASRTLGTLMGLKSNDRQSI